jgi:hypothetical protein
MARDTRRLSEHVLHFNDHAQNDRIIYETPDSGHVTSTLLNTSPKIWNMGNATNRDYSKTDTSPDKTSYLISHTLFEISPIYK